MAPVFQFVLTERSAGYFPVMKVARDGAQNDCPVWKSVNSVPAATLEWNSRVSHADASSRVATPSSHTVDGARGSDAAIAAVTAGAFRIQLGGRTITSSPEFRAVGL